jgi:hypothetical protein
MGCSSPSQNDIPVKKTGHKFYIDVSQLQMQTIKDVDDNITEDIQLKVSISPIEKGCTYNIKLFNVNNDQITTPLNELADCTIKDDTTAILNTPIIIKYIFETEQPLSLDILVIKSDISFNYQVKTTLGRIMGGRKNTAQIPLSDTRKEMLILKGDKLKHNEKIINFKFDINTKEDISFKDKNNKIFYEIYSDIILYRSELLKDNGIFEPVKIPYDLFKDKNIIIKFYDSKNRECGNFEVNVLDFAKKQTFEIKVNKTNFKIISKSVITKNYSFIDYLKSGVEIGLSVAIDFTNSNGNPSDPSSLHYIYGKEPNQYERAISSCGNILSYYDYDQLYPCFGFGAKIQGKGHRLFNLNFQSNPNIQYIEGIIQAYHAAFNYVQLFGPTYFGPIIKEVINIIKNEYNNLKYHILLILTDGRIDDIDDTIEQLVEASFLPLSVIIVGIGKADFSNMILLDADENPLINSKGVKAARDLVQFVPFSKYESNSQKLANEVLEEIPKQILEYYELKNLDPIKLVN